jgi:cyclophilin family peptidyl-prolyl cis-trans isomerase
MKRICALILVVVVLAACGDRVPPRQEELPSPVKNIFHDTILQTIYTLQNQRSVSGLLPYLEDKNPVYRKAAALAFASVQDAAAVKPLAALFNDPGEDIRAAAAYALGQIKDKSAEPILVDAFKKETSPKVKRDIMEALGKCGTTEGLAFITGQKVTVHEPMLLTGRAMGIYRFGLQGIVSDRGTAVAVELIHRQNPERARFFAAHYLARAKDIDLNKYPGQLLYALNNEENPFIRMALTAALGKAPKPEILDRLRLLIRDEEDYRVKVNAVRALAGFEYKKIKDIALNLAVDTNVNISIAAAEFLVANGSDTDADAYFKTAMDVPHWRSRATLLRAALKYAGKENETLKKKISAGIIHIYKKSKNDYEKAAFLAALALDPANYSFLEKEAFAHMGKIIGTGGMSALAAMARAAKDDTAVKTRFAGLFQKAVGSGDFAVVTTAAGILRDPEMNFKDIIKDTAFLTEALDKCKLPGDIEAMVELRKALDYFNGTKTAEDKLPLKNNPIDWDAVTAISPGQTVEIKTSKGVIIIKLMVNQSPGSAANFLRLMEDGFYTGGAIHRVVPNFVVQDGCPRGDGWGSPSHTIGSEFGPVYYEEGSVGMASAGKDTEGSQWFITHSPTPHLDGRYTIFGKVVSGMETVHRLEVGDKILGYKTIK